MILKKLLIILILSSVTTVFADDLIVDKNAMSQYQRDNYYLQFDPFKYDLHFEGGSETREKTPDNIDLSDKAVVLGNSFTQEVWIKPLQKGNRIQEIIGFTPSDKNHLSPFIWITNYGKVIKYGFGTGSEFIAASFTDSVTESPEWYHVAVTFDGTNYKLFINGNEVNNNTDAAGKTPVNTPVNFIGNEYNGKMDDVRMWNVARSESEIKADMSKELTGSESNLVAYYPMNININYELVDLSSNQNHGTIKNVDIRQKYSSNDCHTPDGTESCPYPTINSALDDAKPGDRVLIKEGRYSEDIKKWNYHDVKIEGYPDDNVMIDGTIPLNAKWEPYNHNGHSIYKTVIDFDSLSYNNLFPVDSIFSVFVNERYMMMSMPVNYKNPTDPTTGNPKNPEPGTLFALKIRSPVTYKDEGYWPGELAYLDTLEEWAFDPSTSTLYLYPSPDNIPTSTNVRVRTGEIMLNFRDCDNLHFKNIHFFSGSLKGAGCDHFIVEDSKFSFSVDMMANESNGLTYGEYSVIRNCIFEHMNNGPPWFQQRTMYPTFENVLFRNHDWFYNSGRYPVSDRNYRGTKGAGTIVHGGSVWRYVTVENSISAGIFPGYRSLVEYCRFENLHDSIDGSGIQRNGANSEYSTTRYTWIINAPGLNGMRWDSACSGIQADAHNVVSVGNGRGFRLKGDHHEAYHLLAYDNGSQDISLPSYKYCGPDRWGPLEPGNVNSKLSNSMAENSLECNTPNCTDSSREDNPILDPVFLDSSGIWFGRAYDENHKHPYSNVMFDLADAWSRNRAKSDQKLIEEFGENPWKNNQIQNYDFRPKKGSTLIDGGIVIPGINDGQDMDFNHPPSYPGQNRKYIGAAPDIGAYEYGDSVYWIPGYRYPHPSVPIPSNGTVDLPMEYGLAWNYSYKRDYSNVTAVVNVVGPGVNRTETFQYPNNVLFETFEPGGTYNWSVSVDGVNGGNWTFTVDDEVYPLNDRSVDTTATVTLPKYPINNLIVSNNRLAFLRFDIPSSINSSYKIDLNLVPEKIVTLNGGIVLYKYDYKGWNESFGNNNIGLVDKSLLTPIDTISSLIADSLLSLDLSAFIDSSGEYSFALGIINVGDSVSFYSTEKLLTDMSNNYAPNKKVWPSLSFSKDSLSIAYDIPLEKEWNLISVPFTGVKTRPKQIFSTLIRKGLLEYVSSPSGYFKPGDPYSTLTSISSKEGYYLKLNGPVNKIFFRGRALTDKTISLSAGWNMIAYSPDYELAVDKAFESLIASNTLQYVTGFTQGALVYDPDAPQSSTLNTLKPTKGYWVKVTDAVTNFSFPAQTQGGAVGKIAANYSVKHPEVKPNPSFMFVKGKIMGRYNVGDWVKVLSEDNHVVGAAEIIEGGYLRNSAVYGDDVTTEDIDGLKAGEKIAFAYDGDTLTSHVQFNPMSFHEVKLDYDTFLPTTFALHQNHPNPFNPITTIRYDLPENGPVSIIIYDLMGREIKTLVKQVSAPGRYSVNWNGTNQWGKQIASGIYFYRMETPGYQSVKKLIFLK
jgi:hypothetical protein